MKRRLFIAVFGVGKTTHYSGVERKPECASAQSSLSLPDKDIDARRDLPYEKERLRAPVPLSDESAKSTQI
jgi:hypothetical protein